MTLVVETGAGLAAANTYATRADATAHHALIGNAAWAALTDAQKDAALVRASRFLDASYRWAGKIATEAQALGWPRSGCEDRHGRDIAADALPRAVFEATCEAALVLARGEGIGATATGQEFGGPIIRTKAGSVEVEFADRPGAMASPGSGALRNGGAELIDRILDGLFSPPNRTRVPLSR